MTKKKAEETAVILRSSGVEVTEQTNASKTGMLENTRNHSLLGAEANGASTGKTTDIVMDKFLVAKGASTKVKNSWRTSFKRSADFLEFTF